jgi:catechol 2,3-dioxygenase-like lactoylglutathione lyase family enzyme
MNVQRLDHISFTVGDLDRSVAFYRRFGFEPLKGYHCEGPDTDSGTGTENAVIDLVWLRLPTSGAMLELVRYQSHPRERARLNSRVGAAHLCFAVDDIEASRQELKSEGIEFLSEPHEDQFGMRWVYMRDPDGNAVELVQDPDAVVSQDAETGRPIAQAGRA